MLLVITAPGHRASVGWYLADIMPTGLFYHEGPQPEIFLSLSGTGYIEPRSSLFVSHPGSW